MELVLIAGIAVVGLLLYKSMNRGTSATLSGPGAAIVQQGTTARVSYGGGGNPANFSDNPGGPTGDSGFGGSLATSGLTGGVGIAQGFASGAGAIPIIGAAVGAVAGIFGLISAHHRKMVILEANDLNKAVPNFFQRIALIFNGVSTQQITPSQTIPLFQGAIQDYLAAVANLPMQKGGTCQDYGSGKPYPNPCNGPCTVMCEWILPYLNYAIDTIAQAALYPHSHPTLVVGSIPAHAGFNGWPGITISITPFPEAGWSRGSTSSFHGLPAVSFQGRSVNIWM